ncbi:glycosyltransferase family 4 protein [Candidatus Woesearchaeota archaeon]|nr:glycosyltransferase family 4 protein [Candidatus Woesearchaeota archaeon]
MNKVKIAILAPEFYPQNGGAGTYAIKLVKELIKDENYEVHVITPAKNLPLKKYNKPEVLRMFSNKIQLHNISTANDTFVFNFIFQLATFFKLSQLQKKYHFDVIHVTSLVAMPDIYLRILGKNFPVVVTAHTIIKGQVRGTLQSQKNPLKMGLSELGSIFFYPYIAFLENIYVHTTSHLILTSHYNQKYFTEKYGFKGRIYVTHTGIDVETFSSIKQEIPDIKMIKKPIISYVGRLIAQKGIHVLIEAMKDVKGDYHLVFAGTGNKEAIEKELISQGIKNYTFLGFIPQEKLAYLHSKTAVYVLPSFYEDFPNTILEAMCLKTPIIASRINGIPEMITHNKEGFLFDVGNTSQLKGYIQKLLDRPNERKKLGNNAFLKVNKDFHIQKMTEDTKKIYAEVMK